MPENKKTTLPAVLGMDIGGTQTKIGIVDTTGKVLSFDSFSSLGDQPFTNFVTQLKEKYQLLLADVPEEYEVIGAGIGAPNANIFNGCMEKPHNFDWGDLVPLGSSVEQTLGLKAKITNDANLFAIGEMTYGMAKGLKNFIVMTLGTGFGSGIVVDGKIVFGHDGMGGEMGHVNVNPNGRLCNCGLKGCLETYASVTGIKRTVFKLMADMQVDSILRAHSFENLTGLMIADAALDGDPIAQRAFEYTGEILGTKIADAAAYFSPEAFILGGGLAKAGDLLLLPTVKSMNERLFKAYKGKMKVLISGTGTKYDGVLGAAALAWDHFEH